MEARLKKRHARVEQLTARVESEVASAHRQTVPCQLADMSSTIDSLRYVPEKRHDLEPLRMIPFLENDRFFGRSDVLHMMDEALLPSSTCRSRRFALFGVGGSGKTQIALEYTYSRLQHYRAVMWLLASSAEKIDQDFKRIAKCFGLDPRSISNPGQAQEYVLQRLSSSSKPLIIHSSRLY